MSRYRLPCATVRRDRRSHAVAQRHVYPLHLATPAMPTPEGSTPSTLAKKEGERADWPSFLLGQRAVSEDPRWTRAVKDDPVRPL